MRAAAAILLAAAVVAAAALATTALGRATPAAEPCFGAAARDRVHECRNPRLRTAVYPTPRQAKWMPEAPCALLSRSRARPCDFGVRPPAAAKRGVALIGDSHALHWQAAMTTVALRLRWRGVSFFRIGCPLSTATKVLGRHVEEGCRVWRRRVVRWLAAHPEIRTVVVSQLAGRGEVRGKGDQFELQVRGFIRAWNALPASVERVIVIRDTPRAARRTRFCVMRAARRGQEPGTRCAGERRRVLLPDPAAVAAERTTSRRVRLLDMTRWFCDRTRCFPVIGGALVHQDLTHQTAVWNATLGPYLLREVNRLRRPRA